ncbi:MAG: gliding motility-associated C-terminal domain-containing protein [Bacteroidia bacterium]|nr:gliding motility-associated C-terminal domain-containing protein [Bacteroidia bacterium]
MRPRNIPGLVLFVLFLLSALASFSQPANNQYAARADIMLGADNYQFGTFYSDTVTITAATSQAGEYLLNPVYNKTVWFRFTIPTSRKIRVRILQTPEVMQSNDVGFVIYQGTPGLPQAGDMATFTPLFSLSSYSENICLDQGTYSIQVLARSSAAGNIFVELLSNSPESELYDQSGFPTQLSVLKDTAGTNINWNCLSIETVDELCQAIGGNYLNYTKSAWSTFQTDNHIDLFAFSLSNVTRRYVIRIYEGDVATAGISGISEIYGCSEHNKNDINIIPCELFKPNTTYSIQVLGDYRENTVSRLLLYELGEGVTQAAIPQETGFSPLNTFGLISPPVGGNASISKSDYFSCESQLSDDSIQCGTVNPANQVVLSGNRYHLTTWFTFELDQPSNVTFTVDVQSAACSTTNHGMGIRVYNQQPDNDCANLNHPAGLYGAAVTSSNGTYSLTCMPAGKYSIQLLGKYDDNNPFTCQSQFGRKVNLNLYVTPAGNNDFALSLLNDVDSLNNGNPLQNNVLHLAQPTTFPCVKSVLPAAFNCKPSIDRAKYREFTISDSGMVVLGNVIYDKPARNQNARSVLYSGSASDLTKAQNTWLWPDRFTGLTPLSNCAVYNNNNDTAGAMRYCLVPGEYTLATFATNNESGMFNQPNSRWSKRNTRFWNPANAENLGDVIAQNLSKTSLTDTFTCRSNPANIAGNTPCNNSNKLIYREFYLSQDARVIINEQFYQFSTFRIFKGQASAGIGSLGSAADAGSTCFNGSFATPTCNLMPAGWYTIVSYGSGQDYANSRDPYNAGNSLNQPTRITVTIDTTVTPGPLFNRPYKACVGNNDQTIFLNNAGTDAISARGKSYTLCTENFRQPKDTPFSSHPIIGCANTVRTSYFVFKIGEEMNVRISGTGAFKREVYPLDVRIDSMLFPSTSPLIPCSNTTGTLVVCRLQPGAYTLVVYAEDAQDCHSVTPVIQVDSVGISRFDYAATAYDFGLIAPADTFQTGKIGDVHPIDPSLQPSNDFYFCTTGSAPSDPAINCSGSNYPPVYPDQTNNVYTINGAVRRNLWYSFVIQGKGDVSVRVRNLTSLYDGTRTAIPPFAIYRSDADGNPDLPTLLSTGELDSTLASGLTFINDNLPEWPLPPCLAQPVTGFSFKSDQCVADTIKRRYFVLVDLNEGQTLPVMQIDVQVKFKPLPIFGSSATYDFYSNANQVGYNETAPPYNTNPVAPNLTHQGEWSDLSCATADTSDEAYNLGCTLEKKTVWYKINIGQRGVLRYRLEGRDSLPGSQIRSVLLRQAIAGDSILGTHLTVIPPTFTSLPDTALWQNFCLGAGEYYLLISTCDQNDTTVLRPLFYFEPDAGYTPYDHVSTANQVGFNQVGPPYNTSPITANTEHNGAWGDLTCATNDNADKDYNLGCTNTKKTLWYKVKIDRRGLFKYRLDRVGIPMTALYTQVFRQITPGDTLLGSGMEYIPAGFTSASASGTWFNYCLPAGEYYIIISTCSPQDTSIVRPVVFFDNSPGVVPYDYYSTANEIGSGQQSPPYPGNSLPLNTQVTGAWGDLTCATTDAADLNYNTGCLSTKKSLWYKFVSGEQSVVRIRLEKSGGGTAGAGIRLFSQNNAADSVLSTGFTEIPYLSIVNKDGFDWLSFCIPAGTYFVHIATCSPGETSIVRPVLVSEAYAGDDCAYAIATEANSSGVYNAQTLIYCNTIGGSFGEDGSNMGCLPGPAGYYSTWFRFEYTGSDVVDVLFQLNLSNLSNYGNSGNVRYRLFYGSSCSTMIVGQECANNAFINNSISCINSNMGAFYIQVVYPNTAVGTLAFRYTVTTNTDINCSPFNPFLINADFLYRPSCDGDSIFFTNYSTAGSDLRYLWDFDFPGGISNEKDPSVEFPPDGGEFDVKLLVINPVNNDTVEAVKHISLSRTGNPVNLGNDRVTCIGDTLLLSTNITGATYSWNTGEIESQIYATQTGGYTLTLDLGGCIFSDSVHLSFIPLELDLPPDTFYCPGQTVQLNPLISTAASHQWLDGAFTLNRFIGDTGTYYLKATLGRCVLTDSTHVSELSYSFDLGNDTSMCLANGYVIRSGISGVSSFQWNDNSTADTLRIFSPGSYELIVDSLGCFFADTIIIDSLDLSFSLGNDTTICLGDSLLLQPVVHPLAKYLWSDGSDSTFITTRDSGLYALEINFEACFARDTLLLKTLEKPTATIIAPPENPCINDCYTFEAITQRAERWFWNNMTIGPTVNMPTFERCYPEYGDYHTLLTAQNRCGIDSAKVSYIVRLDTTLQISPDTSVFAGDTALAYVIGGTAYHWVSMVELACDTCQNTYGVFFDPSEVYVQIQDMYGCPVLDTMMVGIYREFGIYLPNTFTPNKDGKNDEFKVIHYGVGSLELKIFNRFGEMVYFSDAFDASWDGSYMGKIVENDVYTYVVTYLSYDGRAGIQRGRVLVLR